MPRRNCNANYQRFNHQFHGEILPKNRIVFLDLVPSSGSVRGTSQIKITADRIVREFRREEIIPRQIHVQGPKKLIIRKIIDRFNWKVIFDLVCVALVGIGITYILGVVVFGPFTMKELWK